MEMPRSFSIAIQSEVTPRRPALPCTAPALLIAAACSASASVSVDFPASGWLITAKVRRPAPSSRTTTPDEDRSSTFVTTPRQHSLTQHVSSRRDAPDSKQEKAKIYSPERTRGSTPTHHDRQQRATRTQVVPGGRRNLPSVILPELPAVTRNA